MLVRLPYHSSMDLTADKTAPREARRRLGKLLGEWSIPQFGDVASLVASELVTNSLAAMSGMPWPAAAPPLRLWACGGPSAVAILAWDAAVAAPVVRHAGESDESGRGVRIVAALSAEWGYYYLPGFPGKVTWAIIDTP
jgi:hypothetical protein